MLFPVPDLAWHWESILSAPSSAPVFLIRNYGMTAKEAGLHLGVMVLISSTLGAACLFWGLRHFRRTAQAQLSLEAASS